MKKIRALLVISKNLLSHHNLTLNKDLFITASLNITSGLKSFSKNSLFEPRTNF